MTFYLSENWTGRFGGHTCIWLSRGCMQTVQSTITLNLQNKKKRRTNGNYKIKPFYSKSIFKRTKLILWKLLVAVSQLQVRTTDFHCGFSWKNFTLFIRLRFSIYSNFPAIVPPLLIRVSQVHAYCANFQSYFPWKVCSSN